MFRLRVQRGCRPEPAEVVDNHSMSDWSDEETAPCFIVRDSNGQALAFVYCEDESGRRAAAKLLTRDEARRIAANMPSCPTCSTSHSRHFEPPLVALPPWRASGPSLWSAEALHNLVIVSARSR
jgi:hypothetical protein